MARDQFDCFLTGDGRAQLLGEQSHLLVFGLVDLGLINELTIPGDLRGQLVVFESSDVAFLEFDHDLFDVQESYKR